MIGLLTRAAPHISTALCVVLRVSPDEALGLTIGCALLATRTSNLMSSLCSIGRRFKATCPRPIAVASSS